MTPNRLCVPSGSHAQALESSRGWKTEDRVAAIGCLRGDVADRPLKPGHARLAAWSGAEHIAAGDLLRAAAAAELAAGLGVPLHAALFLQAPEAVLTQRLLSRAGGRSDDNAGAIRHRFQVFTETTGALVPYYAERGILVTVNADQPPGSVTAEIQARLSSLSRSPRIS